MQVMCQQDMMLKDLDQGRSRNFPDREETGFPLSIDQTVINPDGYKS